MKNLRLPSCLPWSDSAAVADVVRQLGVVASDVLCCYDVSASELGRSPLFRDRSILFPKDSRMLFLNDSPNRIHQNGDRNSEPFNSRAPLGNFEISFAKLRKVMAVVLFRGPQQEAVALVDDPANERILFFWSWGDPAKTVRQLTDLAEQFWNDQPLEISSVDFDPTPERESDTLERLAEDPVAYRVSVRRFAMPDDLTLRDYQKEAIRAWLSAGGRGILAMATGTGKTLTALSLASKVAEKNRPLVVVVVCPYINLATQWIRDMVRFGMDPVPCFHGRMHWEKRLQEAYQRVLSGLDPYASIVVSNATFLSEVFQAALRVHAVPHLLIADEVHNLGAQNLKVVLPAGILLRLGLSATPERYRDELGTQALFDYFGDVVYEFGIARAISENVLVPYHYHPVLVDLTDDEAGQYAELSTQIARAWSRSENDDEGMERLQMLLIRRARLLASAQNKLPALSKLIAGLDAPVAKAIVYCGDGRVDGPVDKDSDRQIKAVTRLLGEEHHLKIRPFTCEESSEEREEILQKLKSGTLDAVVAIRCLDEGIDVPDVRLGFLLASSTNPRQFIQRRGRLLRRAPGKTRAVIYDFIVRPPDFGGGSNGDSFNVERRLFGRELERVLEFCRSAENGPVALQQLQSLRLNYNLLAH